VYAAGRMRDGAGLAVVPTVAAAPE
jgi:hypothetical protein